MINRRIHLHQLFFTTLATLGISTRGLAAEQLPPIRTVTTGPKFHWFGYYDKWQFDVSNRYLLGNQVSFEHRSPTANDEIQVGMVDLHDGDRWIELGTTKAWNWQQGCMLQWIPESDCEVLWNDREDNQFVARIYNIRTGKTRTLPAPVYCISPDGKWGIAPDFRRLNDCRPGYGYAGIGDPQRDEPAPETTGIWKIDLQTGQQDLLFSFLDVMKIRPREPYSNGAKHWFNHLLFSPDGKRFIFLHRWRGDKEGKGFSTRMFTVGSDGRDFYELDPYGKTSHFVWRDEHTVIAWAWHPSHGEKFYLYEDQTENVAVIGRDVMTQNGHVTYLPGNAWILNDTYPDKTRLQHPYLYEIATEKRVPLGHFASPATYTGEWRCDNHPRFSRDGKLICIDSPHGGQGRQMHVIDVSEIMGRK
jgi:hypothetical protein